MGLISQAEKTNAAIQIKNWYDSALSNIDEVKRLKEALQTQLTAMDSNADYSSSDKSEVEALISDLQSKVSSI